jgi:hypothetical protein
VIAALRRNPSVRDVRIRTYVVDDDLSRRTHAIGGNPACGGSRGGMTDSRS